MLSDTCKDLSNIIFSRLSPHIDEITGIISEGFDVTDQLLIRFSAFARYWKRSASRVRQCSRCL
jgi:hypothetical protein